MGFYLLFAGSVVLLNVELFRIGGGADALSIYPLVPVIAKVDQRVSVQILIKGVYWKG
jgi:hypothetical protein